MPLRAVLLDFGGTLDSEGLHWSTQFALAFEAAGWPVERSRLDPAFLGADRELEALGGALAGLGYRGQVEEQARRMLRLLGLPAEAAVPVAEAFCRRGQRHLEQSARLLEKNADRFRFGLVSNYTCNLELVLEETGLLPWLASVICSDRVGLRKPDPGIFQLALEQLGVAAAEAAMVGDSLPADIVPARALGLTTIWIRGDRVYGPPAAETAADFLAGDLEQALQICQQRAAEAE